MKRFGILILSAVLLMTIAPAWAKGSGKARTPSGGGTTNAAPPPPASPPPASSERLYVAGHFVGTSYSMAVYDAATLEQVDAFFTPPAMFDYTFLISPDRNIFYAQDSRFGNLASFDAATHLQRQEFPTLMSGNVFFTGVLSPHGEYLYAADNTGSLYKFDTQTQVALAIVPSTSQDGIAYDALAISPDGRWLYAPRSHRPAVSIIDTATMALVQTIDVPASYLDLNGYFQKIAVSPNGGKVYSMFNTFYNEETGIYLSVISMIDTATRTVEDTLTVVGTPGALVVSPDGQTLYAASYATSTLYVIDLQTHAIARRISVGFGPKSMVIDAAGRRLFIVSDSNALTIVDTQSFAVTSRNLANDVGTVLRLVMSAPTTSLQVCPGDVNHSGSITPDDLFMFLDWYHSGDARGDFNGDGRISVQDVFDFLSAYHQPCQ